jgi:hypothetical protein
MLMMYGQNTTARKRENMSDEDEIPVQGDPRMQKYTQEPWFKRAVTDLEALVDTFTLHGVTVGTVHAGIGKLVLNDPVAGALVQLTELPRDDGGLTLLTLKTPDPLSAEVKRALQQSLATTGRRIFLMAVPEDWSFRTMHGSEAVSFVKNMLAFVSDEKLADLGLKRTTTEI